MHGDCPRATYSGLFNDGKPSSLHPLREAASINHRPTAASASESAVTSALPSRASRLAAALAQLAIACLYRVPGFTRRVASCPVCGGKPDRLEFNAQYSPLDRCGECGHVYSRKTPKDLILHLMYRDLEYWRSDKVHQGISRIEYGPQWKEFLDARIGSLKSAGALMDVPERYFEIGCSEGILLRELANLGHEALGCECNRPTAEAGMKKLGVDIRIGLFENIPLPRAHYDVVASFHTIEHMPDLKSTFAKIADILKPDGLALVEVPTGPEEYANSDHVHFFSVGSLKRLMENHFEQGEVIGNQYMSAGGVTIGSLYGIGRHPIASPGVSVECGSTGGGLKCTASGTCSSPQTMPSATAISTQPCQTTPKSPT
ncbi:class I SAM-dependent methyltransferase [Tahibacter sp.]|uniref:class I SAM-dependent methyltransferase n=1 Tax=Tahibacter sp. TaxID=2056211 RepID=UPI0028C3C8DC|nr:class I SAM-dependent methyltransferase [Tahibacter sp.]